MSEIYAVDNAFESNNQCPQNTENIIEWINQNRECPNGVCPVEYDEDGDVIMGDNDNNPDEESSTDGEQAPEDPVEQSPQEQDEHDAVDSECDEEECDEEDEACVYVVMKDDIPIGFHQLEDNALTFMNNKVSDEVISLMSTYNVNTVKNEDGTINITGAYKNAIFRWTTYNLGTFKIVKVPVV